MSFMDNSPDFDANARNRDGAIPRFYMEPYKHEFESAQKGQPVYKEREMVEILIPGDRRTTVTRIVTDEHRQRWPRLYESFRKGQDAPSEGMPLEEWPAISRGQVEELRFANVRTVEQLAGLPDDHLNRALSMGGFGLREKARNYLATLAGEAPMEKLRAENEAKDAMIATMQAQLADLKARMDGMAARAAKSGGEG